MICNLPNLNDLIFQIIKVLYYFYEFTLLGIFYFILFFTNKLFNALRYTYCTLGLTGLGKKEKKEMKTTPGPN